MDKYATHHKNISAYTYLVLYIYIYVCVPEQITLRLISWQINYQNSYFRNYSLLHNCIFVESPLILKLKPIGSGSSYVYVE